MDEQLAVDLDERVVELEATLKQRDAKIKELTTERDEAQELVDRQREHVEDVNQLLEQWIDIFEMQQNEHGNWLFDPAQSKLWEQHATLIKDHQSLIRRWNKFVGEYNARVAPRERGRPLGASTAQQADVLKRRKAGDSLRTIAAATCLSLQTVRTIVDKAGRKDRTAKRTNALRRIELNRLRAARYQARKAARDRLPQAIGERLETGAALMKVAKGLGR
jgi:DNA-binding CsgD family transcriptional regulator